MFCVIVREIMVDADKANDFLCLLFMDLLHAWLQLSIADK